MPRLERADSFGISFTEAPFESLQESLTEFEEEEPQESQERKELPPWDSFKSYPRKNTGGSMQENKCLDITIKVTKVLVYFFTCLAVFVFGILAKSSVLFAVAQLRRGKSVVYCDYYSELQKTFHAKITEEGRIMWSWCVLFIILVPECLTILQAIWYFFFKKRQRFPRKRSIIFLFVMETIHPVGLSVLLFYCLPKINSVEAAALSCCLCIVPGLLGFLSRNKETEQASSFTFALILLLDFISLVIQFAGLILPVLEKDLWDPYNWILPVALILSSCRWWRNFTSSRSYLGFMNALGSIKKEICSCRYILHGYIAMWRVLIFIVSAVTISILQGVGFKQFFSALFQSSYDIELHSDESSRALEYPEYMYYITHMSKQTNTLFILTSHSSTVFFSLFVQAFCAFLVYQLGKFAYRTHMHQFSFALPITLTTPATIFLILILCAFRQNPCGLRSIFPDFLFFEPPEFRSIGEYLFHWKISLWLLLLISQFWITLHIWFGNAERLAPGYKIFCIPGYDSAMIDQFVSLNRRKEELVNVLLDEDEDEESMYDFQMDDLKPTYASKESIAKINLKKDTTKIYACATMWHEERDEMNQLIGSILRLDKDQSAMRFTQNYYKVSIKDYYELETHIFFDDAFRCMHGCLGSCNHEENETQVNQYVMTLVETVQKNVEDLCMRSSPPIKYPTPYGGRLVWTLPGHTKLTVHLKDKNKIRHRKRWSQVMYMYYLLGYRLMNSPAEIEVKESIAETTYILTLDGDIDFKPSAVKVLIDLMKKDKDLGAACGRIHPVGRGPIVWFQKFEYAIGHWLQKSTEHTIGCVLCSPGCFSLFRAKALMQNNVMAKYATKSTEARHYVQYDQGEDRWLCTLILQVGCRVEYSAASDAYTHAPEAFKEFYIQRRRWIPSTVANIFDLLSTSKETRELNDDISWLYIAYQWVLMGSTILGPGTIFLMLVGAFVAAFHIDNWTSFWYNLIPLFVFVVVCFFLKERIQLLVAEIISAIYGLVMIVVLIGIMLQIAEDGLLAPSTLLFFIVAGQLIIAGLLHPQEWSCLLCGVIYYATVPSMYMLLIIFSIFNLHNVTWGTRESKKQPPPEEQSNQSGSLKPFGENQSKKREKGQVEFSFARLFKCMLCVRKQPESEDVYLDSIQNSLQKINAKLDELQRTQLDDEPDYPERDYYGHENCKQSVHEDLESETSKTIESENSSYISDNNKEPPNFLISPYWLQDERMRSGEVDFLSTAEEQFWKQLIEKYLHPIENDEEKQNKIAEELLSLRNEYLLKFFMINAFFVLIVFLMQLNKDVLHLRWPLGMKYNITYDEQKNEVYVVTEYLRLEPIGCVFIFGFVLILMIQFLSMLAHRFNTFSHILSNAELKCCAKKASATDEEIVYKHADEIAQGLQRVIDEEAVFGFKRSFSVAPSRRRTIRELTENAINSPKALRNFDTLFRRKLQNATAEGLSGLMPSRIPRSTLQAFENRRSTLLAARNRSLQRIYDLVDDYDSIYSDSRPNSEKNGMNHQYDNLAFQEGNRDQG